MAENKFKVLIIDYTQNIYTIFNKKPEKNAIKVENIYLLNKFYKTDSNKYNIVIFDNPQIFSHRYFCISSIRLVSFKLLFSIL